MSKIYICTQGEYSDYHIKAVFSSEKLAKEYQEKFSDSYTELISIEEYEVDEYKNLTAKMCVEMHEDGTVGSVYKDPDYKPGYQWIWDSRLTWVVETDSKERAIKVTNEKRVQIIAAGLWGLKNNQKIKELFSNHDKTS